MKKIVFGLVFSCFCLQACAQDSERVAQLEREIQEIKQRLIKLESPANTLSTSPNNIIAVDGWKNIRNWRQLSRGMSRADVKELLGDPVSISGGSIERWYYPNRADVAFWENVLDSWREPR